MIKAKLVLLRNYIIYWQYAFQARLDKSHLPINPKASFLVSIASYPKRDHLLPAVFQALSRQTLVPRKWILVLSVENYTNGLPTHLLKLQKRGLEILWAKNNPFSVKKLVPTMLKYPEIGVITFDDELIYGTRVIEKLITASNKCPTAIIGHVGKKLCQKDGELGMFYRSSQDASIETNSNQVYFLGGSGTYYPPHSLDYRVFSLDWIHKIVPGRGSDIWFWAAAIANGTIQVCLGSKTDISLYFAIPSNEKTKPLDTPRKEVMENRFQMTIDYFGIREKLLDKLPDNQTK